MVNCENRVKDGYEGRFLDDCKVVINYVKKDIN